MFLLFHYILSLKKLNEFIKIDFSVNSSTVDLFCSMLNLCQILRYLNLTSVVRGLAKF